MLTAAVPQSIETTESPVRRLPVLFVQTSMPVGGAETLLVNLVRRLDDQRFAPEVVCLKEPGPLGELLAEEGFTVHHDMLSKQVRSTCVATSRSVDASRSVCGRYHSRRWR